MTNEITQLKAARDAMNEKITRLEAEEKQEGGNPHITFNNPALGTQSITLCKNGKSNFSFKSIQAGYDWQHMLDMMLLARVQPGAYAWDNIKRQWTITVTCNGNVQADYWDVYICAYAFGCFKDKASVEAAIEALGEDNIRKAAFTLAGKV